ncbi:MAG TPA: S-layer homology domain-containing protein [Planococcus sp. (in: firmicutes)]|nr:S-layer homology domain-containing protein [Planococcus sp. (in: firmicutes)]
MKRFATYLAAIILAISAFSIPAKAVVTFDDVFYTDKFGPEITFLYAEGIVSGYPDGTFRPNNPITRGQAVQILSLALRLDGTQRDTGFRDIDATHPLSGHIASAAEAGIISERDKFFRPDKEVTRGQAAVMLQRAFKFPAASKSGFRDLKKKSRYSEAVSALVYQGVITKEPGERFRPNQPALRGEFAAYVARSIEPSFIPDKLELLLMANDILEDLQSQNFENVAAYASRGKGVTFCPYSGGCIDHGGVTFTREQLRGFMAIPQDYLWGYADGTGDPINLTPAEYYDEFLMDAPYEIKEGYGRTVQYPTRDFIRQLYPKGMVVEFYYPGTEQYDGMDWQNLNMVFERNRRGEWILVAIINDRWTI